MNFLKFILIVLIVYIVYYGINILIDISKKSKKGGSIDAMSFEDIDDEEHIYESVDARHLMDGIKNSEAFSKKTPVPEPVNVAPSNNEETPSELHNVSKEIEEAQGFTIN